MTEMKEISPATEQPPIGSLLLNEHERASEVSDQITISQETQDEIKPVANPLPANHGTGVEPVARVAQPDLHPMQVLPPEAIYQEFSKKGKKRHQALWWKTFFQGIFAGVYIGFASLLATSVGGAVQGVVDDENLGIQKWIFGAVFPFGLILVESTGAELFTGNTAYMAVAVMEGTASMRGLLKNWTCSYLGNFVGSILLSLVVYHSEAMTEPAIESAEAIADAKIKKDFGTAVLKGMLCNWLVCLALWQSSGCKDFASKVVATWLPVSAFVTLGFEHSVANMFFIPLGIQHGADVTWGEFFVRNLIPVTIGNILAGSFIVGGGYALMFGAPGKRLEAWLSGHFAPQRVESKAESPLPASRAAATLATLDRHGGSC